MPEICTNAIQFLIVLTWHHVLGRLLIETKVVDQVANHADVVKYLLVLGPQVKRVPYSRQFASEL